MTIGVVIADIANPFSSILLKGIGDCCKQYGYNVMSAFTDNDPEREKECILSLVDQQVEGLIINTTCQNNDFLEQIAAKYVPIVLADRPIFPTRFDTVRTNDYPVTLETLRYLAQQGYRRVGFFSEPVQGIGTRVLRLSAYHEACRTGVIEEPQEYILPQEDNPQADIELVQSFMARNAAAKKAIFTANGVAMLRVLEAIETLNLTMPDDLGCCGFDNWRWTGLIKPGITAISQPSYEVGMECVKRMMMRIQGSKAAPQMIELVNELVIRGSV